MKIDAQEVKKIIDKYENDGLDIFIEFSRWGIRLRVSNDMRHVLSKILTYDTLDDLPDTIMLKFFVDEFVKDFKHKLQKTQNESEESSCDYFEAKEGKNQNGWERCCKDCKYFKDFWCHCYEREVAP